MKAFFLIIMMTMLAGTVYSQVKKPFRIAIAGLTHTHVHWLLGRAKDGDIEIVGIAEANRDLAWRFLKEHGLPMNLLYPSLEELLQKTAPEAVCAFGSIYEHVEVVRKCAPKKIHVMVEKPLAVSLEHAQEMSALARRHNIHLLTNYETTWYGSNYKAFDFMAKDTIRKIVVHDGHQGPIEIGCNKEFLEWLTDPLLNGGGAITDFGCYGANLSSWLMKGARPLSVFAVTQQIKPHLYPKVDDEATIILTYPDAQTIIQASWNWPYNRKDMEVYGKSSYVIADRDGVRTKADSNAPETTEKINQRTAPYHDPFAYFAAVVRGEITITPTDLSSLENNLLVMEILDAAKRSASEKRMIELKK